MKLEKPETGGLGLSINERRSIAGIYISIIAPGGPASLTRLLKKGESSFCWVRFPTSNPESVV